MPFCLILLFLAFTISCSSATQEGVRLDFGTFILDVPEGWKAFKVQGIDSYAGGLTNGTDTLEFDYGWYSPQFDIGPFSNGDSISYIYAVDTIEGRIANFIK